MVKNFKTRTIRLLVLSILCLNFLGIFLIKFPTALAQEEKFETLYYTPQIEIPFSAISGKTAVGSPDKDGFIVSDLLARYIKAIYDYGIMVGGILAALMLMAGGIIWLTSAGDSGKVSKAKDIIAGSITGVVILMGAYFILNTINPDLVQMKGIEMIVVQNVTFSQMSCCSPKGPQKYTVKNIDGKNIIVSGEKKGEEFKCDYEVCGPLELCTVDIKTYVYSCTSDNFCCECVELDGPSKISQGCWDNMTSANCDKTCSDLAGLRTVIPYAYDANKYNCKNRKCDKK